MIALLEELSPQMEQYSIDECYLDVSGISHCMDLEQFGMQLREHVRNGTGLTIGVGIGAQIADRLQSQLRSADHHL